MYRIIFEDVTRKDGVKLRYFSKEYESKTVAVRLFNKYCKDFGTIGHLLSPSGNDISLLYYK